MNLKRKPILSQHGSEERSRTHCQHLGASAAVVYSNNMGALHTYGSPAITSVVDQHRHDIFARDDYQEVVMHKVIYQVHGLALFAIASMTNARKYTYSW